MLATISSALVCLVVGGSTECDTSTCQLVGAGLTIGILPARVPDSIRPMHIVGLTTPICAMTHDKTSLPPSASLRDSNIESVRLQQNRCPAGSIITSQFFSPGPAITARPSSYLGAFLLLASRSGCLLAKKTLSSHVDEKMLGTEAQQTDRASHRFDAFRLD